MKYGIHVEPDNDEISRKIKWAAEQREAHIPTVPSSISEEKATNPFMRVHEDSVQKHAKQTDPIKTMGALRKEKDNFKG